MRLVLCILCVTAQLLRANCSGELLSPFEGQRRIMEMPIPEGMPPDQVDHYRMMQARAMGRMQTVQMFEASAEEPFHAQAMQQNMAAADAPVTPAPIKPGDPGTFTFPGGEVPSITMKLAEATAPVDPGPPWFYYRRFRNGKLESQTFYYPGTQQIQLYSYSFGYQFDFFLPLRFNDTNLNKLRGALVQASATSKRVPSLTNSGDLVEIGGYHPDTGVGFVLEKRSGTDTYVNTAAGTFELTSLIRWLSEP